eukprot:12355116-Alexandrium_andersonii.AAC.1
MSASLVGSEMCIRDRCAYSLTCSTLALRGRQRARIERAGVKKGSGEAPVSYTHLTLPTICSV